MHLIYDFDSTLFATSKLSEAWMDALKIYGFDDEEIIKSKGLLLIKQGFRLDDHATALGLSGKDLKKVVTNFEKLTKEKAPSLVFGDVLPQLESGAEDHRQSILSFGDPEYQHQKIEQSGVGEFMDDIFIARPDKRKPEHLRDLVDNDSDPIVFFDDNPNELLAIQQAGLPVKIIRVARDGEHHASEEHPGDDDLWPRVSSFEGIEEYL